MIQVNYHLALPKVVEESIETYKKNNDGLGYFIEECYETDKTYVAKSGQLYTEYRAFCVRTGEFTRSTSDFYTALETIGVERKKTNKGTMIYGLQLKSEFLD